MAVGAKLEAVGRALLEVTLDNLDSVIPYYTYDIEYHDPIVDVYGIGDMTGFLYRLFNSTPDLITKVEDEIAIDDVYTATWTMKGVFIADPSDPINSGVPYEAKGMSIIKFCPSQPTSIISAITTPKVTP